MPEIIVISIKRSSLCWHCLSKCDTCVASLLRIVAFVDMPGFEVVDRLAMKMEGGFLGIVLVVSPEHFSAFLFDNTCLRRGAREEVVC
jgi:hypothetical protein